MCVHNLLVDEVTTIADTLCLLEFKVFTTLELAYVVSCVYTVHNLLVDEVTNIADTLYLLEYKVFTTMEPVYALCTQHSVGQGRHNLGHSLPSGAKGIYNSVTGLRCVYTTST